MRWAFFVLTLGLAWFQAVAGFDRQIAGATHKFWLMSRLSDLSEGHFDSDFWRASHDLFPPAPDALTAYKVRIDRAA